MNSASDCENNAHTYVENKYPDLWSFISGGKYILQKHNITSQSDIKLLKTFFFFVTGMKRNESF